PTAAELVVRQRGGREMVLVGVRIIRGRRTRPEPPLMREPSPAPASPSGRGPPERPQRKGSYGIDAPQMLPILGLLAAANVVSGVVSASVWPFVGAAAVLACAGCGLYTSRRGKFIVWAELLDRLQLRGDERVLDLGC